MGWFNEVQFNMEGGCKMGMVKDHTDIATSIENHCRNLHEFKREKLDQMKKSPEPNRIRKRISIAELYNSSVEEIAELVLQTVENYIEADELAKETAREKALADYMFWYGDNEVKRRELEQKVYSQ